MEIKEFMETTLTNSGSEVWILACNAEEVPENGGVCVKFGDQQIALFYFTRRNEWYATQNQCPHRQQMALSRGMIGSHVGEPKIACPFHKNTFSLVTGKNISGGVGDLTVYPVRLKENKVYIRVK
ncbi:MAG: nitrite reductase small subunit NirD [Saprospiraceae bacterium]|nr:nitrite reductase small subunit NirD [Saprospiraceae bacterium]